MDIFKRMSRTLTEVGPTLRMTLFSSIIQAACWSVVNAVTQYSKMGLQRRDGVLKGAPGIAPVSWWWHRSGRRRVCSRVLSVCII
jgi:hypothetical protein